MIELVRISKLQYDNALNDYKTCKILCNKHFRNCRLLCWKGRGTLLDKCVQTSNASNCRLLVNCRLTIHWADNLPTTYRHYSALPTLPELNCKMVAMKPTQKDLLFHIREADFKAKCGLYTSGFVMDLLLGSLSKPRRRRQRERR